LQPEGATVLDTETKRRIDTARDILVGKVPDPKSQVEQITISLIYKFMDDMDAEAEELGGKRTFLSGDFARYGWAKLMRSGLGGHEMLNLYAEAITKMPENPGIPMLFRDIFKNAYLPYRDPETLRAFLKIIDEFEYDHSERLGDAFEYLLSVLSSQGDAGQFRTPRHIIDFMVSVVDPKKHEVVLDPACGTAGFLISSYKHILKENSTPESIDEAGVLNGEEAALHISKIPKAKGDLLSPDDRMRLSGNFKGYDISPDMVRLSLVNMYLHGFADPHIFEYDTLTSLDRWNEYADVILANPPFMSPKGGIKPHNRFSVQSKRSEVLFVDYMAEHLSPNGRAGIIVPEGIIFQSQTAYKQLRKMLVEEYLVAVVSLPAGVFNPYSGVKTSILILDRALAKQSGSIAFFKVENDGFGLGAQRRPIDKNDLPKTTTEIAEYLRRLLVRESVEDFQPTLGLVVEKEKIASNDDYNLSGERYREVPVQASLWPLVKLGDVCHFLRGPFGSSIKRSVCVPKGPDTFKIYEQGNVIQNDFARGEYYIDRKKFETLSRFEILEGDILITCAGTLGKLTVVPPAVERGIINSVLMRVRPVSEKINHAYLVCLLGSPQIQLGIDKRATGVALKNMFATSELKEFSIPLPPLEVQKEIVAEIEGYQKVIDGARAVLDNYRPHIPIHPDWPMVELGEVCSFKRGPFGGSLKKEIFVREGYAVYEQRHAISKDFNEFRYYIDDVKFNEMIGFEVRPGDLIMSCSGTMGRVALVPDKAPRGIINQALLRLTPTNNILTCFLNLWMDSANFLRMIDGVAGGAAIRNVASVEILKNLRISLPPIETQRTIVAEIEAEQALVDANRKLITRMEKKIQATLSRIWGEEESDL
jgi:type I restriction enzyme M protein